MLRLGRILLDARRVGELTDGRAWEYAALETIESLPVLQRVARRGVDVALDVRLHPRLGSAGDLLAQLEAVGESGEVLPLQTEAGGVVGWFVLEAISRRWSWCLPDGTLVDALVTLKLREHRAPEGLEAPSLAVADAASPVRVLPRSVDIDRDPGDVALSEIVRAG